MTSEQVRYWKNFQDIHSMDSAIQPTLITAFGWGEKMQDELLKLILSGRKTATTSLTHWYGKDTHPLPQTGDFWIILDGHDHPSGIVQLTEITIKPVADVDTQFAWDEGEGDRTLDGWKKDHHAFWQQEAEREGFEFSDQMDAAFKRFKLVWK